VEGRHAAPPSINVLDRKPYQWRNFEMERIRLLTLVFFILTMAGIVPCSAAGENENSKLLERVKAYWELQLKDDWPGRYDFTSPGFREKMTREQFVSEKQKSPLQYLSYYLGKLEVSGDMAWAEVSFEAKFKPVPDAPVRRITYWQLWRKQCDGPWSALTREEAEQEADLPPSLRENADTDTLAKRSDELWKAKEGQHLDTIYDFLEPKFKATMTRDEFTGKKALWSYHSHSLEWAEASGDSGRVKVKSVFKSTDPHLSKAPPEENTSIEKWVKVDGTWYLAIQGLK
jgi:hypothetical protein